MATTIRSRRILCWQVMQLLLGLKSGYGGRSTGTSAVPQIADDFGAPRKSAEVGHFETKSDGGKDAYELALVNHALPLSEHRLRM
jgi:hypothetical protein